ncbi:hypothetical protein HWV62_22279 [Athelia sp. TMB]|nr:hypothetical protein HWV62_22279 [Athelia sp. TMB]
MRGEEWATWHHNRAREEPIRATRAGAGSRTRGSAEAAVRNWAVAQIPQLDGGADSTIGRWRGFRNWAVARIPQLDGGADSTIGRWRGFHNWAVARIPQLGGGADSATGGGADSATGGGAAEVGWRGFRW